MFNSPGLKYDAQKNGVEYFQSKKLIKVFSFRTSGSVIIKTGLLNKNEPINKIPPIIKNIDVDKIIPPPLLSLLSFFLKI